jgi:hypothetical protein
MFFLQSPGWFGSITIFQIDLVRALYRCFVYNKTGAAGKNGGTDLEYIRPVSPGTFYL